MAQSIVHRNHVQTLGRGAQAMVFAHGFGSDQTAWRHHAAEFAEDHAVVLFDHVGAGRSDLGAYSPRRYASLHGYAQDLLELLAELRLEGITYVGHSVSGMVGLLAALLEPSRFRRMVFVGASPRYLNDGAYVGGFEQSDLDGLFAAMATNYYGWAGGFAPLAMGNPERPELADEFGKTLQAMRPDIAQAVARVIFQSDHRADLPQLRVPTLIVQAHDDIAVPPDVGRYMAAKIPRSTLRNIDAHGHFPHLSAPAAVATEIRGFIAAT